MTVWSSRCLDSPTSAFTNKRGPLSAGQVTLLGWANVWVSLGILLPGTLSCFPLSAWTLFFFFVSVFPPFAFYSPLVPKSLKPMRLWWHLLGSAGSELQPRGSFMVVLLAYPRCFIRGIDTAFYFVLRFLALLNINAISCKWAEIHSLVKLKKKKNQGHTCLF